MQVRSLLEALALLLITSGIFLASSPLAKGELEQDLTKPYELKLILHVKDHPQISPVFKKKLSREVRDLTRLATRSLARHDDFDRPQGWNRCYRRRWPGPRPGEAGRPPWQRTNRDRPSGADRPPGPGQHRPGQHHFTRRDAFAIKLGPTRVSLKINAEVLCSAPQNSRSCPRAFPIISHR